jgi:deoxyribodipyrimidine photo-lyase
LHFGHLSIQDIAEAVLGDGWTPAEINPRAKGKRDDFFCRDANVNSFLDEAITWRDLGYHWHFCRSAAAAEPNPSAQPQSWSTHAVPQFNFAALDFSPGGERTLDVVLPEWAKATLRKHEHDRREHIYTLEEFEAAATHDELWNAAQSELAATGRMHNYLRMLWAKKVLEWSESPAAAYRTLEHLNNKYALDGRDPNSYTGILWCFGLFDRPWAPERPVFGTVRFMSSEATAKKFRLAGYYDYVRRVSGCPQKTLF